VAVVVAVAGVIFVGHDGEDAYGHGDAHDHHSPFRLGASIHRGKVSLSATFALEWDL
jgi:hypothetical protein